MFQARPLGVIIFSLLLAASPSAQTELTATEGTAKLDGVVSPGEWTSNSITTMRGLKLQAMIDDEFLWVLAQWEDETFSIAKNWLTFDGTTWTSANDEDRVGIVWDMGENGADKAACLLMCHEGTEMRTQVGRVDVWHWKAARSNPLGFVDDKWWDTEGRHGDAGSGIDSRNRIEDGLPNFMAADDPGVNPDYLVADVSALNTSDPFGIGGAFALAVAHDENAVFAPGATIPGRILKMPGGSRSDVRAAGKWADGVWTVEFCRRLTASDDDFEVVRGASVEFTTELFDNEGDTHWQDGFDSTIYTLHFPLPTNRHAQFGNGGGLTSDAVVSNPDPTTQAMGKVSFFGEEGEPLPIGIVEDGGDQLVVSMGVDPAAEQTEVEFMLDPLATLTISTDGLGDVVVGAAIITSNHPVSSLVRFSLPGLGTTGVGTSDPLRGFIVPVRRVAGGINSGIAVHNVGDRAVMVRATLRDKNGVIIPNGIIQEDDFGARAHAAEFIDEIFEDADLDNFEGTLTVEVIGEGLIAGSAFEMGPNPGEFTTLPVDPLVPDGS